MWFAAAETAMVNEIACKQWLWPFFFLGPDLLAQGHLLRHETGPGRPGGPSKKNAPNMAKWWARQVFRIGTVEVLRACDACADMGQLQWVRSFLMLTGYFIHQRKTCGMQQQQTTLTDNALHFSRPTLLISASSNVKYNIFIMETTIH